MPLHADNHLPFRGAADRVNNDLPLQQNPTNDLLNQSKHGTSKTMGSIIRGFKIGCTQWFRKNTDIYTVWQSNYYKHIIRDEQSYHQISEYIKTNPQNWKEDQYFE